MAAAAAAMVTCWTGMLAVVVSVAVIIVRGDERSSGTRLLLVIASLVVVFASTALVPFAVEMLRTRFVGGSRQRESLADRGEGVGAAQLVGSEARGEHVLNEW